IKRDKRPSSKEIFNIIDTWNNEILNGESTEIVAQIKKADKILEKFLASNASSKDSVKIHPEAIYSSRLFDPLNITDNNKLSNNLENLKNDESLLIKGAENVINDAEKIMSKESINNKESSEIDNLENSK
ncbi:3230_t:CDS:2, partial [Racocetra persica]